MIKPFTHDDLIRYIYQEMTEGETELLVQALHRDELLMEAYMELLSTMQQLDQVMINPSETVVKAILKKAKSTRLEKV
ncbi:hypothetical protein [Mongoliitalea daihaiensis]|uniref:hypothetical protein n=1 Tax=Mongoliitalea daihaiensis TaxID=2782006 RepID=UPI001F47B54B|nr:hypothetical protein [Mongoliitalea daihaiensis]UJP65983.1 hypothetical protein IPZ59_04995 [Mongoliitalea daihaiensis]